MKADLTRDTFNPQSSFLRVLMQQGRVQLDADWNEQTAILIDYLRSLAADLMGPFAATPEGFKIGQIPDTGKATDFSIGAGRYYVDGLLCENVDPLAIAGTEKPGSYLNQPYLSPEPKSLPTGNFVLYLDVWERYLSPLEADLMEPALQGRDTATRTQIVWQVKAAPVPAGDTSIDGTWKPTAADLLAFLRKATTEDLCPSTGALRAQAQTSDSTAATNPCILSAAAQYRGLENQLYRVEIHDPGYTPPDGKTSPGKSEDPCLAGSPTFKWSRENGSVIFPINTINGATITLYNMGRDTRYGLQAGDWVEVLNDPLTLSGTTGEMLQVKKVDAPNLQITLSDTPSIKVGQTPSLHPLLRRWDQPDSTKGGTKLTKGVVPVTVGNWIDLENGVQVKFQGGYHRTGDYWLIPARVALQDILWPKDVAGATVFLTARTIEHHYAPLAFCGGGAPAELRPIITPVG